MATLTGLQGANFAKEAYDGTLYVEGYKLEKLVSNPFINFDTGIFTGFQVALYKNPQDQYVIAFAGTDSILDGITDVSMGIHTLIAGVTSQFIQGDAVVSKWINDYPLSASNTIIVGHSLGGSLAQYFGATTQFETLTYNAYGIGNKVSGGSNITNYITMYDPVSALPRSKMIGKTYMLQDETLIAALGHGISNFTSESSWVRGYSRVNSPHDIDVIYDGYMEEDERRIYARINGSKDDVILGGEINNVLIGGGGKDTFYGMGGSDTLLGGNENDTLVGGYSNQDDGVADTLNGGDGYDSYVAGNSDTIYDSDGSGIIVFEGRVLHGVDVTMDSTIYPSNQDHTAYYSKADKGTYYRNGNTGFSFVADGTNHVLTVYTPLDYTLKIIPKPGGGTMKQKTYRGVGVVLENFSSPLVLDLNHDGVTSLDLYATPAYFDMEKDGIREKTGWIQSTDALLAFDKNRDGIINDGSELFGNYTTLSNGTKASNGFEALAQYDNNHDRVIDKNDSVYNALSAWIDSNQDGITDTGELHSLSELGVTSINLNATETTTYEDQNAISHTSSFTQQTTDAEGNTITETKTVNDVWFRKDTTNTLSTVTISDAIAALPQINGSGRVLDLHGAMQERTALKTAVETYLNSTAAYTDQTKAVKNILSLWSNTDNISATQSRGEQWILNHNYANAQPVYRYRIFAYARDVAILEQFSGTTFSMTTSDGKTTNDVVDSQMAQEMTNRLNDLIDTTMIKLLGQKLMGDGFYDTTGQANYDAMFTTITTIMESGIQSDKETASTLIATIIHRDGFESLNHFNQNILNDSAFKTLLQNNGVSYTINPDGTFIGSYKDTVEGGSGDDILQSTANGKVYGGDGNDTIQGSARVFSYQLSGENSVNEELHGGDGNDILFGWDGDDILYGDAGDDTLYANNSNILDSAYGHDILTGGEGNDTLVGTVRNSTYVYSYGDGNDTIIDSGNVGVTDDVLELRGIRAENVRVTSVGNDMLISIKDIVDENSDSGLITIKNGMGSGKIEQFVFDDVSASFSQLQLAINGLLKDDIYTFNRGDGSKFIIDYASVHGDALQFGSSITANDIEIKVSINSSDLIVALKEEGKTFSDLSDKLTISNWFNADNRIETFNFSDGTVWDANTILAHQGTDEADITRLLDTTSGITLSFGDGNDVITTGSDNDTLVGGTGNDTLLGDVGNDTYIFAKGDGKDTIIDAAGFDTLRFGEGIGTSDLTFKVALNGIDLIVGVKEDGVAFDDLSDKITLTNWFDPNSRIENFSFTNGTVWGVNDIIHTQATEGEDLIHFADINTAVSIHLLGGDDYISGSNKDDTIYGDSGNDVINTGLGNDTLIGGTGNDMLQGGVDNDTYVFAKGDGADTIIDSAGNDTLRFAEGITQDDILLRQEGNNFRVAIKDGNTPIDDLSDSIVLKDWFSTGSRIENFRFSDGSTLVGTKGILTLIGSDSDDTFTWKESVLSISMGAGNDIVTLGTRDDMLIGGEGNDTLQGGGGNDTYIFNHGDGQDTIIDEDRYAPYYWNPSYTLTRDSGNDTLQFTDGITADDLIVKASANSNDLIVAIKEDGVAFDNLSDKITLKNWFNSDNRIEAITFDDGTVWDISDIVNAQGTDDADTIHLLDSIRDITLNLRGDNDSVTTANGNNTINGGEGNDSVNAGGGDDTLIGGTGNDTLQGDGGNDTYVFAKGDGIDTIFDTAGNDTLKFTDGISVTDLIVKASANSNDLIVALKEDGIAFDDLSDKITLKNWFNTDNRIESFVMGDGTVLDTLAITKLQINDDTDNYLRFVEHDTIIDMGKGNDTIEGSEGNDTYLYSIGNGSDTIQDITGIETIRFGEGISIDNLEVHSDNDYLTIGLKQDGVNFVNITDKLYIKRVGLNDYGIENLEFSDSTIIDPRSLISTYKGTDGDDTIDINYLQSQNPDVLIDDNLIINAENGNDTVTVGNGANMIDMGDGDDAVTVGNGANSIKMGTGMNTTINAGDGDNTVDIYMASNFMYSWIESSFGNGNNRFILDNDYISDGFYGGGYADVAFGDGNNIIQIGKKPSVEIRDQYLRQDYIFVGDGENTIGVSNGDGILGIQTGKGNNIISFSADVDSVGINMDGARNYIGNVNGNNTITQIDDTDIEYSYYGWYYDYETKNWYQSDELIIESYANDLGIGLGNGDNTISLTDTAQNYLLSVGDGNNTIAIGSAQGDNNYAMSSSISMGNGDNQVNILSGDGNLSMNGGVGNNTISFTADIDNTTIKIGGGNNIITQITAVDTDSVLDYYGGGGSYYGGSENNGVLIELGLGSNTVTLGSSKDTVFLSNDAYKQLDNGAIGLADIIDVGAGNNYVNIASDVDHTVEMGGEYYQNLASYRGEDYNRLYLGNGDNTVKIKGADEVYAEIGDGDNMISIDNTLTSQLNFDGGNNTVMVNTKGISTVDVYSSRSNTITMGDGATFLDIRYANTNTIVTGSGADEIYTLSSNDTYHVNVGDGNDAVLDMYGYDKIVFGEGIDPSNFKVTIQFTDVFSNDPAHSNGLNNFTNALSDNALSSDLLMNANLVIQYSSNPDDKLTLINWYDIDGRIEQFQFSDGSTLSDHQIVSLIGTAQDDLVMGTEGDNTLHGGEGEDEIDGGTGNDTYLYNRGDSNDTFNEDGGFDTIAFGKNIMKNDLILQQVDNNLIISLKEDGKTLTDLSDTIIVNNWFDESGRIERFTFSDGTSMELDEMLGLVDADGVIYYGTPNEDAMEGSDNGDIIMALESNDVINGNGGNDLLFGEAGDDILDGGEGDNLLYGGEGNDTYIIDYNMGSDTVFDQSGSDTLKFVNGITSDDIGVWFENNDLKVGVDGTEVTLINWYTSDNRIEIFAFDDGTTLNVNDIINLQSGEVKGVSEGTTFDVDDGDETIYYGQNGNDTYRIDIYGGGNIIIDSAGNDRIEFANDITPDMVALTYEGDDLILSIEGTNVRLSGWYTTQNRIETFGFEDGTMLTAQNIIDLMGTDRNNLIRSLQEGGEIHGNSGDDTISSSKDDNLLYGGEGNDTYVINEFAGVDVIDDTLGVDTIRFGGGITPDSLRVTWIQGSEDIYLSSKNDTANGLILKNWYSTDGKGKNLIFSDETTWNAQNILDAMGSEEDDVYDGFSDRVNVIRANGGSDAVCTFAFDDTVDGGAGDDAIDTGTGNDTLIGGTENDLLFGGAGDDTYIFDRGFGKDMIYDTVADGSDGGNDRIVFGEGISADDITVKSFENDNNLYIGLKEDGKTFDELSNVITIKDWYLSNNRIESITFGDAVDMSLLDLMRAQASPNGEAITALGEGGMLIGTENEDTLIGNMGDDFILGMGGDDTLIGGEVNDTLIGGSGNDLLKGSEGNDAYFFGKGDGKDTIYDNATAVQEQYGYITDSEGIARWSKIEQQYSIDGGVDTLYFSEGITSDDLSLSNDGYDLVITLKDSAEDTIRIQDYYKPFNTIEYFGFSDGTMMSNAEFEALLFTPGDDNVTLLDDQNRVLYGERGNDIINGGSGNDVIDGGAGDDILNGGFGDDIYLFGRGSGHDMIADSGIGVWWQTGSGNDSVVFKDGLSSDDLVIQIVGNDVVIGIKKEGKIFEELSDTLIIKEAFDGASPFESVQFSNGMQTALEALLVSNTPPEALVEVTNILQDIRVISGEVGATDADNDTLSYTVSIAASHGTFSVDENGTWNYRVADGYMGDDTAVITIDDANGGVISQTLNFNVQVSAPLLANASVNLFEDTSSTGTLNVLNPIGGALLYEVLNASTKGTFTLDEQGNWNYDPTADVNGNDSVTIKVTNEYGLSTTATLSLAIEAINDAPVLTETPTPITLNIGTSATGMIKVSDIDGDTLSYSVTANPEYGTLTINENGEWSYTADPYYAGVRSAMITVDDGKGGVIEQTLNFTMIDATASAPTLQMNIGEAQTMITTIESPSNGWNGIESMSDNIGTTLMVST
ncbi:MAG: Ig-like domain-containing protein, partial [Campylobacterales bacterium]|nr:Ig-like domain-containing protein [Campylobacterales bacterium]